MALQRRRRSYSIASGIRVPNDLRPHIGRREIVKSLKTSDSSAGRLKGAHWEGHVAALFARVRQNSAMMNREQIDALVSQYLDAELHEVEQRFATNAWKVNDHGEHGDWNTVAQSLLADENEKAEQALQCNELQSTLGDAKAMLQGGPEDAIAVLARRLLAVRHEALWAEAKGVAG